MSTLSRTGSGHAHCLHGRIGSSDHLQVLDAQIQDAISGTLRSVRDLIEIRKDPARQLMWPTRSPSAGDGSTLGRESRRWSSEPMTASQRTVAFWRRATLRAADSVPVKTRRWW